MRGTAVFALAGALAATAAVAEERRELGAHEHGHSTLTIAVEGTRVAMELSAPGADIVGFEHAAETDEQKAARGAGQGGSSPIRWPCSSCRPPPAAGSRRPWSSSRPKSTSTRKEHARRRSRARGEASTRTRAMPSSMPIRARLRRPGRALARSPSPSSMRSRRRGGRGHRCSPSAGRASYEVERAAATPRARRAHVSGMRPSPPECRPRAGR